MSDFLMKTYKRLPGLFVKGEGSWLFDTDGKKHLDFTSGIAVNCLGHNYPPLVKAINAQAARILHTSNYFLNDTVAAFAQKLVEACAKSAMKNVFLGNSGAEANEGACKIARKYSLQKYGPGRHTIVTLQGSFHGRTITTLSATGQDKFHKDFGPFTEGFLHIPAGDIDALDRALDAKTVAGLWIEPVQGESGIVVQSQAFIETAAKMCAERDILLMADEIQCGLGRTGTFLAIEQYAMGGSSVKPDLVTLAKGISGGVPSGAVLAGEKTSGVFAAGDHGSTFGGNPLAAACGLLVLDTVNRAEFMLEIARKGEKIMAAVRAWEHPGVKEVRGRGLMIGIDVEKEAWPVLEAGVANGLLMLSGGPNTLRLLPPYTITDSEIEEGLAIMKSLL